MSCPSIPLNTGRLMPQIGLGTWKAEPGVVAKAVQAAIEAGYRHIDCACDYGNEAEVGEGIKNGLESAGLKREDIFVTSKLWNTFHRKEHVLPAVKKTLGDLGLDYLDLYLIHFPISLKYVPFETRYPPEWFHDPSAANPKMEIDPVPVAETWAAMESLVDAGLVKSIGVSNFGCQLVADLLSYARIPPAVNQIEIHPYLTQEHLVRFCQKNNIVVTAYSPLGAGSYVSIGAAKQEESVLTEPLITDIANKHSVSPAQVCLKWGCQRGMTSVPKSSNPDRIKQNIDIFSFELSDDEMKAISSLNKNRRFNDPGMFCEGAFNEFYPIH